MDFVFDIKKTIAAAGYLCQLNDGKFDMLKLIKTLYVADRQALVGWHRTITGDRFVSMKNGPVLSRVYDLIRGRELGSAKESWDRTFKPLDGYCVSLHGPVNTKPLSQRELDALKASFEMLKDIPGKELVRILHEILPEWKDPKGSSAPIDPKSILFSEGMSEDEISEIEKEVKSSQSAKASLLAA